jgi:very-short-patch-repair endonuclease
MVTRSQVTFPGIGRVDLLVQGCVVVEADGDEFHSDVQARRRDRRRDAMLAAIDRPVLRFGYDQLVGRPDEVARALIRTVGGHRGVKNPGSLIRIATNRARKLGWT